MFAERKFLESRAREPFKGSWKTERTAFPARRAALNEAGRSACKGGSNDDRLERARASWAAERGLKGQLGYQFRTSAMLLISC